MVGSCCRQTTIQATNENISGLPEDVILQSTPDNGQHEKNYTVEDTVRNQIGGKLYYLTIGRSDSITVIGTHYYQPEEGDLYREYQFIVHSRYTPAHRYFEFAYLDSVYNGYMADPDYLTYYNEYIKPQFDSVQSKRIIPEISDFNGYWVYLKEYNGNYYLNDEWAWHGSFRISDNILTNHYMDGPYPRKISETVLLPKNGISILCAGDKEPLKIEVFDKAKWIYRIFDGGSIHYITPARAVHNFEIIQYTNNTGDLI